MAKKRPSQPRVLRHLRDRYIGAGSNRLASVEHERQNLEIAMKIYELRTRAGVSQRELAKRVKTSASAICRLEDADYEGHSLAILRRIAAALGQRVEVRFVPLGTAKP